MIESSAKVLPTIAHPQQNEVSLRARQLTLASIPRPSPLFREKRSIGGKDDFGGNCVSA